MNMAEFEGLSDKTIPIWLQVQDSLGLDFNDSLLNLIQWLKTSGSLLSMYLIDVKRKPTSCDFDQLTLRIVNDQPKNLNEAYKQITVLRHLVIKGNESEIWDLPIPNIPILAAREKGIFTPKRFSSLPCYEKWRYTLDSSILYDISLSEEAKIGQILVSSIVYGGLLSTSLLAGLLKMMNSLPSIFNNRAYFDLSLSWLGHQGSESRRWFMDPLTEILIWIKNKNQPVIVDYSTFNQTQFTKVTFKYILSFFREAGLGKADHPTSISAFLDTVSLKFDLLLPPFISNYCQRKHLSHSIRQLGWNRIESVDPKLNTQDIIEDISLERWTSSPALNEDDFKYEKEHGEILPKLPTLPSGLSKEAMKFELDAKISMLEDENDLLILLFEWGKSLLNRGKHSPKADTVKGYIRLIGNRLYQCLGDERLIDLDTGTIEDIYLELLEDIDSKGLRKKLSQQLYSFHKFLVNNHDVAEIDYRSVLGASYGPTPVDANILLIDEFNQLLQVIEDSDLILNHPKLVTATKLLAILGYRCGLRRSEALKLRLIDIYGVRDPMLLVRPFKYRRLKTASSKRVLPLSVLLEADELEILKEWLKDRKIEEETNPFSQYLFSIPDKNYVCISEDLVFPVIHSAMRATTGDDSLRYHHFRHSFASLTLLRLMVADHGVPVGIFDHQADTLKWLEKSKEFRDSLYSRSELTRRHLYQVAFLLGHSSPSVTLEHYIHTLDIISSQIISNRFKANKNILISASKLPQSTAYRLFLDSPFKLLNKIRIVNGFVPISHNVRINNKITLDCHKLSGYKIYKDAWQLLFLYSARDIEKTDLLDRFKITENEFALLINNVNQLLSFTSKDRNSSPKFKMMKYKDKFDCYNALLCPARPTDGYDIEMAKELCDRLYEFKETNYDYYRSLMDLYINNAWSTKYLVVFKDSKTANNFIALFSMLGIPENWLKFSVIVGQSMVDNDAKKSLKAWMKQLDFSTNNPLQLTRGTDGVSMGKNGWLGFKLVDPTSGHSGLAQRYSFIMSMICSMTF
ncbi:MAG: tyrosine-type recombinase/integrase [Oceanospirillaceae bacterium]|nr:tyrosine-type recombinase/integrase [Oceanospirillaceae bacterium]